MEPGTRIAPLPDRVREALRWYAGTWRPRPALRGLTALLASAPLAVLFGLRGDGADAPLDGGAAAWMPWPLAVFAAGLFLGWLLGPVRSEYEALRAELPTWRAVAVVVLLAVLPPVMLASPPKNPTVSLVVAASGLLYAALVFRRTRAGVVQSLAAVLFAGGCLWVAFGRPVG